MMTKKLAALLLAVMLITGLNPAIALAGEVGVGSSSDALSGLQSALGDSLVAQDDATASNRRPTVISSNFSGPYDGKAHKASIVCNDGILYYRTDKPFQYDFDMMLCINMMRLGKTVDLTNVNPTLTQPGTMTVYYMAVPKDVNFEDVLKINKIRLGEASESTATVAVGSATVKVKAQSWDNEPNNTMASADSVSLGETVSGNITADDERDYYRFYLPSSGRVSIAGTAYMQNTKYYIYDESGNEVWSKTYNSWNSTTKRQDLSFQVDLTSGAYYLCMARYNSSCTGPYSFRLSFASANETFAEGQGGSNNSIDAASRYSIGTPCNAQIAVNDDRDFFRFYLPSSGRVSIAGTAYMQNTKYYIYDESGNEVWSKTYNSWNSTTKRQDLSFQVDLASGAYYLCVARYDSSYTGPYNFKIKPIVDMSSASVSGIAKKAYTGSEITQSLVVKLGSTTLCNGKDYQVAYSNNKYVGQATLTITGKGDYMGSITRYFTISKAVNPMKVKAKSPKVSAKSLKSWGSQYITPSKAFKVSNNQGSVSFKKLSGNRKISVSSSGWITVEKGLKKGTYKTKVRVKAAGNGYYKAKSVNATVKIRVK